jgi:DNA-binding CsgD family transcriptional regulator
MVREGVFVITTDELCDSSEGAIIRLTEREIEVLRLILEGRSSKEAAASLCCSKRTVDFHLARVYQKLEVSNRVQAMRRVAILGLIPIDPDEDGDNGRH